MASKMHCLFPMFPSFDRCLMSVVPYTMMLYLRGGNGSGRGVVRREEMPTCFKIFKSIYKHYGY